MDVPGVAGHIAHPVGLAGVEAIAVHGEGLDAALGVGDLHQLARLGILVGGDTALGVGYGGQAALLIVGVPGDIPLGVRHRGAVARPVIGIGGHRAVGVGSGGQVAVGIDKRAGVAPAIGEAGHMAIGVIGIAGGGTVAVPHGGDHAVAVVGEALRGAVRISYLGDIPRGIMAVSCGIALPVGAAGHLVEIVVGDALGALGIGGGEDAAQLVIINLQKIAVRAGADVVAAIEVIGKIEGAKVGGVLMDYPARIVIGVFHVDVALEVGHRGQIAIAIVGVAQAVPIGVLGGGEQIALIGQGDGAAHAVGDGGQVAAAVIGEGETAGIAGHAGELVPGIGKAGRVTIDIRDVLDLPVRGEAIPVSGFVLHDIAAASPLQGVVAAVGVAAVEVQAEEQLRALGQGHLGI